MPACLCVLLLFYVAGCSEPGLGDAVPGIEVGMTEDGVLARLGMPTHSYTYPVAPADSVLKGSATPDLGVGDLAAGLAPGETATIRRSEWEDVRTWPWEAPREWKVAFVEGGGGWVVLASSDTSSDVVFD